jgi:hypothetical protein
MAQTDKLSDQFECNYQPTAVSQNNYTSRLLLGPQRASLSGLFSGVTAKLAFDDQSDSYKNLFNLIENQHSVTTNDNLHSHLLRSQAENSGKSNQV